MLGHPYLDPKKQPEWTSLILQCLPCKTLPKRLNCPQDVVCLERIACNFEDFTVHSTLFQVSGSAESKRKHFLKLKRYTENHRCICSANMSVRMWTTSAEEVVVQPGEGNQKSCAFHAESTLFRHLLQIPDNPNRLPIMGSTSMLQTHNSQQQYPQSSLSSKGRFDTELTDTGAGMTQAPASACLERKPMYSAVAKPTPGTTHEYDSEMPIGLAAIGPVLLIPRNQTPPEHPASPTGTAVESFTSVSAEGNCKQGENSQKVVVATEGRSHTPLRHLYPQCVTLSEASAIQRPSRGVRLPFFSTRIPNRDTSFFGREEILVMTADFLSPTPISSNQDIASMGLGNVLVLHGVPGVGKSAIALELAYRSQELYDHVLWLRANNGLHLAQSFHEAAIALQLVQNRGNYDHEDS